MIVYDGTVAQPVHPNVYKPNAVPGSRAPHLWLGDTALCERLEAGFTLLRFGGVLDDLGKGIAKVGIGDVAARDIYGAVNVLIRSDQQVDCLLYNTYAAAQPPRAKRAG